MAYNYEYPYTDPHRYNDDWLLNRVKTLSEEWLQTVGEWRGTQEEFEELKKYIQNYFGTLDIQEEVDNKLDRMVQDGTLSAIINDELLGSIDRRVSEIEDGVWIVISDSYGTHAGNAEGVYTTMYDYMREISGKDASQLIGFGYSGDGFIRNNGGHTFLEAFTIDSENIQNKESVKKIVIAAGRNDTPYTIQEIVDAERVFYNYCKANYPNANVYFAFIANGDDDVSSGTRAQQWNVYVAYQRCVEFGGIFINGPEAVLHGLGMMSDDTIHPSLLGKRYLAHYLLEGIKNGSCTVYYPLATQHTTPNSNVSALNIPLIEWVENNQVCCYLQDACLVVLASDITPTANNAIEVEIGEISDFGYFRYPMFNIKMPCHCSLFDANNEKIENGAANIIIKSDGKVYISFYMMYGTAQVHSIYGLSSGFYQIPAVYC